MRFKHAIGSAEVTATVLGSNASTLTRDAEIANLERRVIEAAVVWRHSDVRDAGDPFWGHVDDLRRAVDALIATKEKTK
jgi:hypothetical protein